MSAKKMGKGNIVALAGVAALAPVSIASLTHLWINGTFGFWVWLVLVIVLPFGFLIAPVEAVCRRRFTSVPRERIIVITVADASKVDVHIDQCAFCNGRIEGLGNINGTDMFQCSRCGHEYGVVRQ